MRTCKECGGFLVHNEGTLVRTPQGMAAVCNRCLVSEYEKCKVCGSYEHKAYIDEIPKEGRMCEECSFRKQGGAK